MLSRKLTVIVSCLAIAAASVLSPSAAQAQKKQVTPAKEFTGSVDDEKLMKNAPVVTSKAFEKLWADWGLKGKAPEVDFTKNLAVRATSRGSKLSLRISLDEKGNLSALGLGTRDLRPGFRYVIAIVSKEGVETVNGKKLPKE